LELTQNDSGGFMRIRFKESGGMAFFPGLNQAVTLDSDQMTEEEAGRLKQLVDAARFFERPANVGSPQPGAADYKEYSITIEEGEKSHTVRLVDPVEDAGMSALLTFIRTQARAARSTKRSSPP
jgi:hypothetical protein